ncbi:MAG: translation elongation factor Ts [Candidatus Omnitrophica bacterium]|nr:translation elongation factor Ts [Candidatus Omnitrophota bacterium]
MSNAPTAEVVRQLREKTGVGIMECKRALTESAGDIEKAVEILRKKGIAVAQKRAGRATKEGLISSYVHMGGKIGVLVEIGCETDFVAKNDDFKKFSQNIAMHIAAANPQYLSRDEAPSSFIEKEKEIFSEQIKNKPAHVIDKIIQGKIDKRMEEICLLDQKYIKDDSMTINDYVTNMIARIGENMVIRRFVRYGLGEESNT